jgi:hypothetical protein
MTEIKAKISDLLQLNRMTSMKGKDQRGKEYCVIPDYLLVAHGTETNSSCVKISDPFLEIEAIDTRKALTLLLIWNKVEVLEAGAIPIGDAEKFADYLERFNASDDVVLKTEGNDLVITRAEPFKKARYKLADLESLTTVKGASEMIAKWNFSGENVGTEKTHFDFKMTVDALKIKEVTQDGETVNQRVYPILVEDGMVTMNVGSESLGSIETDIGAKIENYTGVKCKSAFAYGLDNIFSNLTGEVQIELEAGSDGKPMLVRQKTDAFSLMVLLASVSMEK